jgi:hypothetical protein
MSEENEPSTTIITDHRRDSYKSFFDHDWMRELGVLADKTKLRLPAFDLTRDWKGIAVAGGMPWL